MTDSNQAPLRIVTAASLFDGHDAAINVMRRLIQDRGCEVIHLGHNRSVDDIVKAALQEDADGIALSSYQGGHNEYFRYLVDRLRAAGAGHVAVIGGGGGTITPEEIRELEAYGVTRIYHPNDGLKLGLPGMIDDAVERIREARKHRPKQLTKDAHADLKRAHRLSDIESGRAEPTGGERNCPTIGLTGTGGAGKSSLTDELVLRFATAFPDRQFAVLAVDPTRRRTGGALLGDRIRMNSLRLPNVFFRSMATRRQHLSTSEELNDAITELCHQNFDLVFVETAGIGQSDSAIVDLVDIPGYVMTPDYGAASQLEKIDMLDLADWIAINKFDGKGAQDALRDVRKQWRRNRIDFETEDAKIPVYPTIASHFSDPGVNRVFNGLCRMLAGNTERDWDGDLPEGDPQAHVLIPGQHQRYLAEIAEQGQSIRGQLREQAELARQVQHLYESLKLLGAGPSEQLPDPLVPIKAEDLAAEHQAMAQRYNQLLNDLLPETRDALQQWDERMDSVQRDQFEYQVRDKVISGDNYRETLSGNKVPKVAANRTRDWGERVWFTGQENLPGHFPYTGGVYPYRRAGEDPTRMFAGEGPPERTNRRFHYLSLGQPAARLSTAFDSVTLYGEDPAERPDIYGKVGNSGVSIATLDDMKKLYSGFDLCAPTTSVSMTINGPAPIILAMFLNTAIDQQVEKYLRENGQWDAAEKKIKKLLGDRPVTYQGELPEGHTGLGLGLLGVTGDQILDAETYQKISADTLKQVRGTVQADILKEDQAQNTCIFSTEFALHLMGDVQSWFIDQGVRNFYSVSVSGYHIAEAGANPITQLAFTLANGFTLVEYYRARGMDINAFAPNLSFFFSNGMDPEYAVIGRVARRIWSRAMKYRYGANARSQMLKYHIQTSGRSLHAQEIQFNDIRTTLQALYALFDNCNSLHTNAFDEAITTPTEESVRRAVAIQLIINKELGLNQNENPLQGSFTIDYLTDLVEDAVYAEFERLSERGGVLGAMDSMYQRGKIQDESMVYEHKKHSGDLPIIGVNTFLGKDGGEAETEVELMRSTDEEKQQQIEQLTRFHAQHGDRREEALAALAEDARQRNNLFDRLMETVKVASLGQISHRLYEVGGEYRRNM
ncbi:methylmalonyl-CoA mutase family protein [Saccharospirillum salsuginis]|uniref:Fused isobutyryl-CoA mutase n=1 Tax=Saccharospirillum salsuginis TaxID=418750 RepID=A0A918NIY5_9GAMM|nr:methylmalonyl-CoA mutase family protein [Saccharospirillum salsuginis]GGX73649.1 Fused isobutyryl-CoA mutase [Saccharospirillum salsuginis]